MIYLPEAIWSLMLDEFAKHGHLVERVCFLDGFRLGQHPADHAVVTTLTLPNAELTSGNYLISAADMSVAGAHLRRHGMARLAQVHTHGNDWVDHSTIDDERAYSQRPGALSLVLPHHAARRPRLEDAGTHLREGDGWRRLAPDELASHITLVPSALDHRNQTCLTSATGKAVQRAEHSAPATRSRRSWWPWKFHRS